MFTKCIFLKKSLIIAYASRHKNAVKVCFQAAKIVRLDIEILQRERKALHCYIKTTYHIIEDQIQNDK